MSDQGGVAPSDLAVDPNTGMAVAPNALLGAGSAWRAGLERTLADINRPMFPGGTLDLSHPMLGFAGPGSIKGFHGTPHLFEPVEGNPFGEFRNEAIGTGEGAQAYGYGHYVAGNPKVAEDYRTGLAGRASVPLNAQGDPLGYADVVKKFYEPGTIVPSYAGQFDKVLQFHEGNPEQGGAGWSVDVQQVVPKPEAQFKNLGEALQNPDMWQPSQAYGYKRNHTTYPDEKDLADVGQVRGWQMGQPGALLEVHILPHEHELLDWDKPLAEQPERVQQTIDKIHAGNENLRIMNAGSDVTGENFYRNLGRNLMVDKYGYDPDAAVKGTPHDQLASQALHEAGIPGIRYLDAGSRNKWRISQTGNNWTVEDNAMPSTNAGGVFESRDAAQKWADENSTHNYVIFDPSNLRIIARNGQRLEPVEHDPFQTEPGAP